mgnify:CR=1 FL=1
MFMVMGVGQVAMSFVAINASRIAQWAPGQWPVARLHDKYTDVHLSESQPDLVKRGPSAGACQALALSLLLGCSLRQNGIAVTGSVDLRGVVHGVGGVEGKVLGCQSKGVPLLLMPQWNLQQLEAGISAGTAEGQWGEEQRAYVRERVKGVVTMLDVFQHSLLGEAGRRLEQVRWEGGKG